MLTLEMLQSHIETYHTTSPLHTENCSLGTFNIFTLDVSLLNSVKIIPAALKLKERVMIVCLQEDL